MNIIEWLANKICPLELTEIDIKKTVEIRPELEPGFRVVLSGGVTTVRIPLLMDGGFGAIEYHFSGQYTADGFEIWKS